MGLRITEQDILSAQTVLSEHLPITPLSEAFGLSEQFCRTIFCKWDNKFRTGSFKERGALSQVQRVYEIDPLECPKCKAQMRIIAFIQDERSIKEIMKSKGNADFRAPPPIPKFIDASEAIDELPSYDLFEPASDDF